jgi:hypothetical protein
MRMQGTREARGPAPDPLLYLPTAQAVVAGLERGDGKVLLDACGRGWLCARACERNREDRGEPEECKDDRTLRRSRREAGNGGWVCRCTGDARAAVRSLGERAIVRAAGVKPRLNVSRVDVAATGLCFGFGFCLCGLRCRAAGAGICIRGVVDRTTAAAAGVGRGDGRAGRGKLVGGAGPCLGEGGHLHGGEDRDHQQDGHDPAPPAKGGREGARRCEESGTHGGRRACLRGNPPGHD